MSKGRFQSSILFSKEVNAVDFELNRIETMTTTLTLNNSILLTLQLDGNNYHAESTEYGISVRGNKKDEVLRKFQEEFVSNYFLASTSDFKGDIKDKYIQIVSEIINK